MNFLKYITYINAILSFTLLITINIFVIMLSAPLKFITKIWGCIHKSWVGKRMLINITVFNSV